MEYTFIYTDGSISRHDTLDGLVEMLLGELLDDNDREVQRESYEKGEWSDEQKIQFIEMFDITVKIKLSV